MKHPISLDTHKIYLHFLILIAAVSTLQCDPTGPFKSCGSRTVFDDTATCVESSASLSGGKLYCHQGHCCKEITHGAALANAMALNGTSCSCKAPWPCVHVDNGGCHGSGSMADYPTDAEVIARCWDGVKLSGVPCVGGTVVISAGISFNVIVDGFLVRCSFIC